MRVGFKSLTQRKKLVDGDVANCTSNISQRYLTNLTEYGEGTCVSVYEYENKMIVLIVLDGHLCVCWI